MAFTYSDALVLDRDRVRFAIGDTPPSAGPKPDDGNFTDAEIAGLLDIEGSWQRAVAGAFETLSALWAKHVTFIAGTGMQSNQSDIANSYRTSAKEWRDKYGYGKEPSAGSEPVVRADGYSDDIDNVTVEYL